MNPNTVQQVPQSKDAPIEFVPYGSQDAIKLSVSIIRNYVAIPTKSNKLPDDRECVKFLMLCRSRRLNPFEGDCFLQGYDGRDGAQFSLITAHQAFLKRAECNPEYDGMRSGTIVRDENGGVVDREGDFTFDEDTLLGAWAIVYFKVRKTPTQRRIKLSTFRKPFGRWNDDPAGMIVKCAEADALRSSFPTLLGGLYSVEEVGRAESGGVKLADISDIRVASPKLAALPAATQPARPGDDGDLGPGDPITGGAPAAPRAAPDPLPQVVCRHCNAPVTDMANHECEGMRAAISKTAPSPAVKTAEPASDTDALESVALLAKQSNVSEDAVLTFCKRSKLAKDTQTEVAQLATSKLQSLIKTWPNIVAEITAIQAEITAAKAP